ncbi:type III-B CRISPR module-associated protein Cmr5 [Caldanaerobacter subterraneus]|uniref:CRISPR type III-B/RAMP module-associated protein Cmr5 n=1 Tax=Caldanaerobacter subterraneus TaxID=911092 RepID=A0A4R2JSJ7_9THEO|nr:type III-B CRISPR module-associated protein Cmr5 [Caldanaerobacter subterraneus]TCO60228.1 CRISPR-associated protein Cmr5 [Caldanaerobacter subterraneus]
MSNELSTMRKLEKGRAEFAYDCVRQAIEEVFKGEDEKERRKEYRSYARKIPTMILTNGLGQALAFLKAKAGTDEEENEAEKGKSRVYRLLYEQITRYMKSETTSRISMPPEREDLLGWVISCDSVEYRYITQEILAFLTWLSRFAEGMIEK